ncbi:MAG: methyltransferase family protein [uncultured bacterium]|nr:MAG: methyltransferase family protein [uncultured bacterium]
MSNSPVKTFDELYSDKYFSSQLEKFKNRENNHWAPRIKKVFDDISYLNISKGTILDLGCSIGTYAYEFASRGYHAFGIDLSPEAIAVAKHLADENKLSINYTTGDISERKYYAENTFDIIYAGDIIEHLENDILSKTIFNCNYWLKPGGYFIFHTVPLKYDYIFHKSYLWLVLIPFAILPDFLFKKIVQFLYISFNLVLKNITGRSWSDREKETVHCNLQEKTKFESLLKSKGFKIIDIKLTIIEDRFKIPFKMFFFKNKEYYQKDLFGIAKKL